MTYNVLEHSGSASLPTTREIKLALPPSPRPRVKLESGRCKRHTNISCMDRGRRLCLRPYEESDGMTVKLRYEAPGGNIALLPSFGRIQKQQKMLPLSQAWGSCGSEKN